MSWFYNIKYGIQNLIKWVPVIWKDRDWDHAYCSSILRHKLLLWAEHEETYGHHIGCEKDAKRMRICAELLKRVEEDNYADQRMKAFDIPGPSFDFEDSETDEFGSLKIDSNPGWVSCYRQGERQRLSDLELCFKMLGKHYLCWWN